ncbi:hypothetical protein WM40_11175 [Robbsia andropogonis]|uniref:Uncharacterized protein n=1 Tax=Robbsia andropogonis TaxID=28092 RepID=A0A0F5K0W9_9BURK|nr:hypothetical protein WM40_11175 [Robbsia andropogonis]
METDAVLGHEHHAADTRRSNAPAVLYDANRQSRVTRRSHASARETWLTMRTLPPGHLPAVRYGRAMVAVRLIFA